MFNFFKTAFQRLYQKVSSRLSGLFSRTAVDAETLAELERILIEADTGSALTRTIVARLSDEVRAGRIAAGSDLKTALATILRTIVAQTPYDETAQVVVLVGINGSGKTTAAGKLAHRFARAGHPVILAAADTFRAAAADQLAVWAERAGATLVRGSEGQDPASIVFAACEKFKQVPNACLIIDTAGRLQTKTNLMRELEKIGRTVQRQLPQVKMTTLLTVDAMLGQNSFDQARLFHESTRLDGVILTKCDGTGKGGIVFAIADRLKVPVAYVAFGEQIDQLASFNADEFVEGLLNS